MKPKLEIRETADVVHANTLIANGFCNPAALLYLPQESLKDAFRFKYGERRDDPRFVVTGNPRESITLLIACMVGLTTSPVLSDIDSLRTGQVQSIIQRLTDGESVDLLAEGDAGSIVLAWRRRQERRREPMWEEAVYDWPQLITGKDGMSDVAGELASAREAACSGR